MSNMNVLFEIAGLACAGLIIVREFTWKVKKKPFNCELCMAFWMGVLYFHSVEGVLYSFVAAIGATILNRYV